MLDSRLSRQSRETLWRAMAIYPSFQIRKLLIAATKEDLAKALEVLTKVSERRE